MRKVRVASMICFVSLMSIMIAYPVSAAPKVFSGKLRSDGTCKRSKRFSPTDDVFAVGRGFPPNTPIFISVTTNRRWSTDDDILDFEIVGIEDETDSTGRFACSTPVAAAGELDSGRFDIVVDVEGDGTLTAGNDAVNSRGTRIPGFRVR